MTASEARGKVLAVYPKAYSTYSGIGGGVHITVPQNGHVSGGRLSGYFGLDDHAWIDAASLLPAPKPIEPASKDGEKCMRSAGDWNCSLLEGHDGDHLAFECHDLKLGIIGRTSKDKPEPAQVESGDGLPRTTREWLEDALGRWQVTHCHSSIREALKTVEASLQRERELVEEVERLKGLLRISYPCIYFAAQEHVKQGRPGLASIAEFINLRIDEVFKAAVTAEKVSSR